MEFVISHLAKNYGKHQVLIDVDYAFEEGKIYGLLGRNGAGKTTLFNCLNSDCEFDCGRFYFKDGDNVFGDAATGYEYPKAEIFSPPWEHFVPTLGMNCSQGGNNLSR